MADPKQKDEAKPATRLVTRVHFDYVDGKQVKRAAPGTKVADLGLTADEIKQHKASGDFVVPQDDE